MNTFLLNTHSVPLTDLLTLNTAIVFGIALIFSNYMKYNTKTTLLVITGFLAASVMLHPMFHIPDNLSYYFGFGKKPVGWRGL